MPEVTAPTRTTPPGKRVIFTSKSRRGGSRIGKFDECPTRFYRDNLADPSTRCEDRSEGTDKGDIGHVLMAHTMLHRAADAGEPVEVNGEVVVPEQASDFNQPADAAAAFAKHQRTERHLLNMQAAVDAWEFSGVGAKSLPLHIESETFGVWGRCRGQAGVWTIDPNAVDELSPGVGKAPPKVLPSVRGHVVTVAPMDVPGHPEHGWPVWFSRRRDLVWRTQTGQVHTVDYKFLHEVSDTAVKHAYGGDKWLHLMYLLDSQEFGAHYGGLWLLAIRNHPRYKVNYYQLRPSRVSLEVASAALWELEHRRAELERDDPTGRRWHRGPMSACNGRYSVCPYFEHCHG